MVVVHFAFKSSKAVFFMASSHHQNRLFLTAYSNGKIHLVIVCHQTILSTIMRNNIQCLEAWSTIAAQPQGSHGFICLLEYPSSSVSQHLCFSHFGKKAPAHTFLQSI